MDRSLSIFIVEHEAWVAMLSLVKASRRRIPPPVARPGSRDILPHHDNWWHHPPTVRNCHFGECGNLRGKSRLSPCSARIHKTQNSYYPVFRQRHCYEPAPSWRRPCAPHRYSPSRRLFIQAASGGLRPAPTSRSRGSRFLAKMVPHLSHSSYDTS